MDALDRESAFVVALLLSLLIISTLEVDGGRCLNRLRDS